MAPVIEALTTKPVVAIALNRYFDHGGGWHSFNERLCHPLEAEALADPSEESSSARGYLTDESLSALPRRGYATSDYGPFDRARMTVLIETQLADLGARRKSEP